MKTNLIQTCLLAAALLALPAAVQAQFTYTTNNGTITITGYTGSGGAVNIPATISGLPLTGIGVYAFSTFSSKITLTSVTIPSSVTNIGIDAFVECDSLTAIIVDINNPAYSSLAGVLFDKGHTALIQYPGGKTGSYLIPDSVTSVGESAFEFSMGLTSVTIPNSVTNIGNFAFELTSLANITIPGNVTSIGDEVFGNCTSLTNATIADGVTRIGSLMFYNCTNLTSVTIPNSVTSIGDDAFDGCGLTSVTLSNSVTTIGDSAFENCYHLTSITMGNGITNIGDYTFAECVSLTSVTIPDSVTNIGNEAFWDCYSLTNVTIGNDVASIGEFTFYSCGSLTSVTIPNGVVTIGDAAFFNCTSLTSVTVGNGVTNIGDRVFSNCNGLTSVYFSGNVPPNIGMNIFVGGSIVPIIDPAMIYYLPNASGWSNTFAGRPTTMLTGPPQFGTTADGWNYVSDQVKYTLIDGYAGSNNVVVIPSLINGLPVTGIGSWAFLNNFTLASVTIPDSMTSIGDDAFLYDYNLTNVTIGNSVTSIGDSAFEYCYSLTSVTIGNGVTNIGDSAFIGCIDLTKITVLTNNLAYSSLNGVLFDKNQTTLIQYPIGNTTTSYAIPSGVTSIGDEAFSSSGLTSVTIPDSVTSIGNNAFYYCTGLTSVKIGNGVTSIGEHAFDSCYNLTSVTIPDNVASIGDEAFLECVGLTNVTIGNSVTSIGDEAFELCYGLTSVYFTGNAPTTGSLVFNGDHATVYYLPGTLGWSSTFAGVPTALWFLPQPLILNQGPGFGVQSNRFGFIISWATSAPVVVETCTNLSNPNWLSVSTNTLISGASLFSDPQSSNYPARFYRLRSP